MTDLFRHPLYTILKRSPPKDTQTIVLKNDLARRNILFTFASGLRWFADHSINLYSEQLSNIQKRKANHSLKSGAFIGMYSSDEIGERKRLAALRAGSQDAFDYFYRKYRTRLYVNILKLTKSHDLATELLQEVFMKVWQKRGRLDTEKNFGTYIYVIAQRTVYDFFRRAARDQKLEEQLVIANKAVRVHNPVEERIAYRESLQLLNDGIAQLPPQCRRVFQLCKLEGKTYEEVAVSLGISTATVNNHIVKATKILKRCLAYRCLAVFLSPAIYIVW